MPATRNGPSVDVRGPDEGVQWTKGGVVAKKSDAKKSKSDVGSKEESRDRDGSMADGGMTATAACQQTEGDTVRSVGTETGGMPSNSDIMTLLTNNHVETQSQLKLINTRLDDQERSINFAHDSIADNKKEIELLKVENTELRGLVNNLNDSMLIMQEKIDDSEARQDRTERRSREWGIRVHGIVEADEENTRDVLSNFIAKNKLAGLDERDKASRVIEHCHRLGNKATGKPRAIIANFFSRPMRYALLKDAKKINNDKSNTFYISEDLIKKDHTAKLNARPQMKAAYERGDRVSFKRGQLFINSQQVKITL